MRGKRPLSLGLVLLMGLASISACDSAGDSMDGDVSVLLALDAESATSELQDEFWRITLEGVSPRAVFMDERPDREAGVLLLADLVSQWDELGFESDPPNVFLAGIDVAPIPIEILKQPDYSTEGTMSFDAQLLGSFAGGSIPSTIEEPSLVIDSSTPGESGFMDLTMPQPMLSGYLFNTTYDISGIPSGTLATGKSVTGSTCPGWLACAQSGAYLTDDAAKLRIEFDQRVNITVLYLLDFYTSFEGDVSEITITWDSGSINRVSDPSEDPSTSGYEELEVEILQASFLEISSLAGTFSLAGLLAPAGGPGS